MRKFIRIQLPPLPYETKNDGMVSAIFKQGNDIQSIPDWVFPLSGLEEKKIAPEGQ